MSVTVVDTGPLVAYFNKRDRWHRWVVEQMSALSLPLITCEPVITEAAFLIKRAGGRPEELIRKVVERSLQIGMDLTTECAPVAALMARYNDTPMSLADACLVRLAERIPGCRVFTLDGDFMHYRRNGRQVIPLLHPS